MSTESKTSLHGSSFMVLLFLLFLTLKLTNVIDWSWWWVAAPLWAGAALALIGILLTALFMVAILAFAIIASIFSK